MSEPASFRLDRWTVTPVLNLLERDGRSVRLEPRAMDVLVFLAHRDGRVASVDEVIAAVWKGVVVGDGSAYLAIRQLRQALGESADGRSFIETIPKRGYRLTVRVEPYARDTIPENPPTAVGVVAHRKRVAAVATLVAVAALAAFGLTSHEPAATTTRSVAVRPFASLSTDPEQQFVADGVSAAVLSALSDIRDLRVVELDPGAPARKAEHVLAGSVRRAGDHVRITVQLSDARTGAQAWSQTYERGVGDVFSLEDDIAASVADALQIGLGIGDVAKTPGMTRNVAAYAEYRRAMQLNLEWRPETFSSAIAHLQRALALDPSFSVAWAGLNTVYANGALALPSRADEWRPKGAAALAEARTLTPDAPHVLLDAGIGELRRGHWLEAAAIYEQLSASYERYGVREQAWGPRGVFLLAVGRVNEAIPALERASAQEPRAPAFAGFLSHAYLAAGDPTAALAELDRGLALEGLDANLRRAALAAALTSGARTVIDARSRALLDTDPGVDADRRLARLLDSRAESAAEIRTLAASASSSTKASLARWAAFYGEPELALELLADAAPRLAHPAMLWEPLLRDARQLDGFQRLVRDWGLVDYWRVYGWPDFCHELDGGDFECR